MLIFSYNITSTMQKADFQAKNSKNLQHFWFLLAKISALLTNNLLKNSFFLFYQIFIYKTLIILQL